MSVNRNAVIGNMLFWMVLLGASGGAFGAGFYYTYAATANVNTKIPGEEVAAKVAPATPEATPTPAPIATAVTEAAASTAPGPLPIPSEAIATPKPRPKPSADPQAAFQSEREAFETPQPIQETPTPAPRRSPTPEPRRDVYRVQVGGFGDRTQAQRQVEELQSLGINAVVVYDEGQYRAQLGAFSDRTRAKAVADEVNMRGYSVKVRN